MKYDRHWQMKQEFLKKGKYQTKSSVKHSQFPLKLSAEI